MRGRTHKRESKAFELNIQNSLLLLKLSGLPNSDELSTMTETKTGEIQGPLKPEEFSQAFAFSTRNCSTLLDLWCWDSVPDLLLVQNVVLSRAKTFYPSREAKSPGFRGEHDWELFFRCSRKRSILEAFFNLQGSMILQKDVSGDASRKAFHYLEKKPSEKSDLLEFGHSVLKVVLTTNVFHKLFFYFFF